MLEIIVLLFTQLFLAALGLCGCVPAFPVVLSGDYFPVAVRRLLIAVASLVAEQGF